MVASAAWDAAPPSWWAGAVPEVSSRAFTLPLIMATGAGELLLGAAAPLLCGLHDGADGDGADGGERIAPRARGVLAATAAGSDGDGVPRATKRLRQDAAEPQSQSCAPVLARSGSRDAARHQEPPSLEPFFPLASVQLPGQVFGAQVVFGGCVLVGARDDCLHCLFIRQPE